MRVRHFYFNFISTYFVLTKDYLSMLGSWTGCLSHQAGRERHTIPRRMSFLIFLYCLKNVIICLTLPTAGPLIGAQLQTCYDLSSKEQDSILASYFRLEYALIICLLSLGVKPTFLNCVSRC